LHTLKAHIRADNPEPDYTRHDDKPERKALRQIPADHEGGYANHAPQPDGSNAPPALPLFRRDFKSRYRVRHKKLLKILFSYLHMIENHAILSMPIGYIKCIMGLNFLSSLPQSVFYADCRGGGEVKQKRFTSFRDFLDCSGRWMNGLAYRRTIQIFRGHFLKNKEST
jgi:hypothetical protein